MKERLADVAPRSKAKLAGAFYLLTIVAGSFALFVSGKLIVSGDAGATSAAILAHENLFRWAVLSELIATVCYLVVTALFYQLFKPVNGSASLVAAFFSLAGCAIGGFSCLFRIAPLSLLGSAHSSIAFKVEELQALSLLFTRLYAQAYNMGLLFFGSYCLLIGYLIFRSTFLPRALGVLVAISGLAWLTGSISRLLSPDVANRLSLFILPAGAFGEVSLCLWLLVVGVNAHRWSEQANAANAWAAEHTG